MKEAIRIFVIGHPAVGKAYFSKHLAERLGYHFIDADMGLEHRIGLTLEEIIGRAGIEAYEQTQEKIFAFLSNHSGVVVGLDCYIGNTPNILAHLQHAVVVYLKTTLETQIRRCGSWHESLISESDYAEVLKALHEQRDDFYNQISHLVLQADEGDVDKDINTVSDYLKHKEIALIEPVGLIEKDLVFFKHGTDIPVRISEQQAICFKYVAAGRSAKEIAREMEISHRTVEVYIAQLKEKLECDSSKDLINLYLSKH